MNFKDVAIKSAKLAGRFVKEAFCNPDFSMDAKGKHDIVTSVDRSAEHLIIQNILKHFPSHSIHSEEFGDLDKGSSYTWYIDPLDGTSNFFTGNPYYAISIALANYENVIVGVVYVPMLDDIYSAEKGQGACLNDERIWVSERNRLADSFIACAYSSKETEMIRGLKNVKRLSKVSRRVVVNFAPSLDLCNVASGRLDALVDNGSTPEDHAAGSLILTEAGGVVRNFYSTGWDFNETGIVASNGFIYNDLLKVLKK